MNRSSKTRSNKFYPNPNEVQRHSLEQSFTEDEVDSQAEPAFQTQNYVFQLQSKCHNLQYEKTKNEMAYTNLISELRQKNAYLEQLASTLSHKNQALAEERDEVRMILSEVREKNHELAKQIQGFKMEVRELENFRKHNYEEDNEENLIDALEQKDEEIGQRDSQIIFLQKELNRYESNKSTYQSESASILKKQITSLEKELHSVKAELDQASKNQQLVKSLQRQKEQLWKQMKIKDSVIAEYEEGRTKFEEEIQRLKENASNKERKLLTAHNQEIKRLNEMLRFKQGQLKQSENGKVSLDCKVAELTVELGRIKSQNNGLDQYNKYLQGCNAENEAKRKQLQQEIYQSEKEISQLRTSLFNEKLENKKLLSNIRLSFEEEKIKHLEQLDEKSKEILKIKELSVSSQRQNVDLEEINNKYQSLATESEKNEQIITSLKAQNQRLKQDIQNLQSKYDKKNEKMTALQKELKTQYEGRIKMLEGEVYKLQTENSEMQLKVESKPSKYNNKNAFFSQDNEDDQDANMIELLKLDKKQKEERIQQLLAEKEEVCNKKDHKISKLQAQIKQLKDAQMRSYFHKEETQDKLKTIDELQSQISRLNSELRKERSVNEQTRRQASSKQQKLSQQLRRLQEENDSLAKNFKAAKEDISIHQKKTAQFESQLKTKEKEIGKLQNEQQSLRLQLQSKRVNELNKSYLQQASRKAEEKMDLQLKEMVKEIQEVKRSKERQIEQYKQQLKKQMEARHQLENSINTQKKADESVKDSELKKNYEYLSKENYQIKRDYSQALEQINSILLNYKNLQQKHKKAKTQLHILKSTKISSDYLLKQVQQLKQANENYETQVHRLNHLLMEKDRDIKKLQPSFSPHLHNGSRQAKRTKETDLWLNPKSPHSMNFSTIIKRQQGSHLRGSASYKQ